MWYLHEICISSYIESSPFQPSSGEQTKTNKQKNKTKQKRLSLTCMWPILLIPSKNMQANSDKSY